MADNVDRKLIISNATFRVRVWPMIKEACGGGYLVEVPRGHDCDKIGGVDFWQVLDVGLMRGIASRVQFTGKAENTFTIGLGLHRGPHSEYAKRWKAVEYMSQGWLLPALTVQAYMGGQKGTDVLSVAVAWTWDLVRYVKDGREWMDWYLQKKHENGEEFIVVPWQKYEQRMPLVCKLELGTKSTRCDVGSMGQWDKQSMFE